MNPSQIQAIAKAQAQRVRAEYAPATERNVGAASTVYVDLITPEEDTGGFIEVIGIAMGELGGFAIGKKIAQYKNLAGTVTVSSYILLATAGTIADFDIVENSGKVAAKIVTTVSNVNYKISYSTESITMPEVALP